MTTNSRNDSLSVIKRRAMAAMRDGRTCGKCGRQLADGETVWLVSIAIGYRLGGSFGYWQAPVGAECAYRGLREATAGQAPESCAGCSRGVFYRRQRRHRRRALCSERCGWMARNRRRSERTAATRSKCCAVCDRPFVAPRSDAATCSAACRQRAYRQRAYRQRKGSAS